MRVRGRDYFTSNSRELSDDFKLQQNIVVDKRHLLAPRRLNPDSYSSILPPSMAALSLRSDENNSNTSVTADKLKATLMSPLHVEIATPSAETNVNYNHSSNALNSSHLSQHRSSYLPKNSLFQGPQYHQHQPLSSSLPVENELLRVRHAELDTKYQIDSMRESVLDQYALREERLQQELLDQRTHYETMLIERDKSCQLQLEQRDLRVQELQQQLQDQIKNSLRMIQDKEEFYLTQIRTSDEYRKEELARVEAQMKETIKATVEQLSASTDQQLALGKAQLDLKEAELAKHFDKKVRKLTKQVEDVIERYRQKELLNQGSLEEARREILVQQANYEAIQQTQREELQLKDKRLIEIRQELDSVDELKRLSLYWRDQARDLATVVIHTCATVEELPSELWSSTTPGLFSTVWDELRQLKTAPGYGKVTLEEQTSNYSRKKSECVITNRAMLSKCLRYSKYIHERLKTEDVSKEIKEGS